MDTKELQIGDWVLYTEFGKNEFHRVEIVEPTRVWLNGCKTYVPDEFIEPIPLTPEILEKNWFKKYAKKCFHLNIEEGVYVNIDFTAKEPFVSLHNKSYYSCPVCLYVHQLQHAFRSCRISKDIVL